ncbi:DUF2254 domain-containing protein [Blastococcus sp. CT_GayMR19]|uniref:DUF2254 domain-containing protein n=1 Tax=Blastococcus sp. CT_GayMR19 TaxID=2559608 RepID=UPI00107392B5|nr:DUF2254 domain-containing protein [Blastococcus sp. CT_GayMR19]TFV79330.1 DUF2254 domain-containing protein [Blastococcus sp. CT_GayMR19]
MAGLLTSGRRRLARLRTAVNGALWPIPAALIVGAIGLGVGLPILDGALQDPGQVPLIHVFGGGPSAARSILGAIAGSLISVTTLLFSLTIVTLQLASSQYTPRLLQTFVRDRVVQVCLGTLLGTFVYALTVLRSVRSADESGAGAFVPRISVTVGFLFTLASVAALLVFLAHQTGQLRVETMMREVHAEASETLDRLARQLNEDEHPDQPLPPVAAGARPLCATASGFLVQVQEEALLLAAADAEAALCVDKRPGDAVVAGTPLAWAWPLHPGSWDHESLETAIGREVTVAHERSEVADPSYGLRKLVDIAARALSPGINDPTTAVHALSHLSALLGSLTERDTWHRRLTDDEGRNRVFLRSGEFGDLLDLAVTQIRDYGRRDATVVGRLFGLLAEVGWQARTPTQRNAVGLQCRLLTEQSLAELPTGRTADDVHRWAAAVDAALDGRWQSADGVTHPPR